MSADTTLSPGTRYVTSQGYDIAYQVVGDGEVDVLWVGGFATNVDAMWDVPAIAGFMARVASWSRLIVFDKRGTGISERVDPDEIPTVEERLSDLRAVLDAVDSHRAALVGDCEGGALSALFAATHPERVSHLVLSGAIVAPTDRELVDVVTRGWGTGVTQDYWAPSTVDVPGTRDRWAKWERGSVTRAGARALFSMANETDVRSILPAISVPTLVAHRTGDRVAPVEHAREAARHIEGCRLREFPGEDHSWWFGDPEPILHELRTFLVGRDAAPAGHRALTTVLFTDVAGSTELAQRLGDTAWRSQLDLHDRTVTAAVDRFQGRTVKHTGDGILACFDRPGNAVRSAALATRELAASGLEIRCGVHTGECDLREGDLAGVAVHIAARVVDAAEPGEVLVTRTVRDLLAGSDIALEPRGERRLRGVDGEWELLAVQEEDR